MTIMGFFSKRLFLYLVLFMEASSCYSFFFSSKALPDHLRGLFDQIPSKGLLKQAYVHLKKYSFDSQSTPTDVAIALAENPNLAELTKQIVSPGNFEFILDSTSFSEKTFQDCFHQNGPFESVSTISLPSIPGALIRQLPKTVKNLTLSCAPSESCYRMNDEDAQIISEHFLSLEKLDLSYNRIEAQGVEALVKKFKNLKFLLLNGNSIGPIGAKLIVDHLFQLNTLEIGSNQIGDEGAIALSSGNLKALKRLVIFHNGIGQLGGKAILDTLKLRLLGGLPSLQVFIRAGNPGLDFATMTRLNESSSGGFTCL